MSRRAAWVCIAIAGLCLSWACGPSFVHLGCRPAHAAPIVALDTAFRLADSVTDFSDYVEVARNQYAADISDAFKLGLVVGRYDDKSSYYDPDSHVTTGEMANILARNLGADRYVQGQEAFDYLGSLGVVVSTVPQAALTLAELQSLAVQIKAIDVQVRADLLVLREAMTGSLGTDPAGGITRAHAVAMYRLPQVSGGGQGGYVPSPPTPPLPPAPGHDVPYPTPSSPSGSGGASTADGGDKGTETDAKHQVEPIQPVFVLTG